MRRGTCARAAAAIDHGNVSPVPPGASGLQVSRRMASQLYAVIAGNGEAAETRRALITVGKFSSLT